MEKDENGQWIITNPLDFIGWEIYSVEPDPLEPEYGFLILVNKGNRLTRRVRSHYTYVPVHSVQHYDE